MSEDLMVKCLIAFILGWIVCRMMGEGFSVGAKPRCKKHKRVCKQECDATRETCNANCEKQMIKCQDDKYDDNYNLLGEDIIPKCKDNVEVRGNIPGEKFTIDFCSKWCGLPYQGPSNKDHSEFNYWSKCGIQAYFPYVCDCAGCGTCKNKDI